MINGTATSYFRPVVEKKSIWAKINIFGKVRYWKITPTLKLAKWRKINSQSKILLKNGLIESTLSGISVRYEIKGNLATFDVSPDGGKTYLNYLRGTLEGHPKTDKLDITNSIAMIEAMILTGYCLTT
jgi:hypothetical protein